MSSYLNNQHENLREFKLNQSKDIGIVEENDDNKLFRDLFVFYDPENTGYITIEKFLTITRENIENWKNEEEKLGLFTKTLDPFNMGRIDFDQFLIGMKKLTSDQIKPELDRLKKSEPTDQFIYFSNENNPSSHSLSNYTFNEYDTDHSQINSNTKHSREPKSIEEFDVATFNDQINYDEVATGELISLNDFETSTSAAIKNPVLSENFNLKIASSRTQDRLDIETDPFGFDVQMINNHRNSLTNGNLFSANDINLMSMGSPIATPKIKNMINSKKRTSQLFHQQTKTGSIDEFEADTNTKQYSTESYEQQEIVENYENKIKDLNFHNDSLSSENHEYIEKVNKLSHENSLLIEKTKELEENAIEAERKFKHNLDIESSRHQEALTKLNTEFNEEKDNYLIQISNLEKRVSSYKEENLRYRKELNEISRKSETDEKKLTESIEKFNKLKSDHQKLISEKEQLKMEAEIGNIQNVDKIKSLERELEELRVEMGDMIHQKQRANTVYASDDQLKIKEMENEINALKIENGNLNNHIVELDAHVLKQSMDAGKFIVSLTTSNYVTHKGPSLADELEKMPNDELIEKLKTEQQITARLKEYLDNILTRIMEHSPELLEKCLIKN